MARRPPQRALSLHADLQLVAESGWTLVREDRGRPDRARHLSSVSDLRKKLVQYIKLHSKTAQRFEWTYFNPKHRVRAIRNPDVFHY